MSLVLYNARNIRGFDADVVFVDECAFVKEKLLLEGVFPVSVKTRTATILATTPGPPTSYFMRIIGLKNEKSEPLMHLLRFGQPCASCMKTKEPWLCTHDIDLPSWKDKEKEKALKFLWHGNMETFATENAAIISDKGIYPFKPDDVNELHCSKPYREIIEPDVIFMSADSAEGGSCEEAIVAVHFPDRLTMVIIYADAYIVENGNPDFEKARLDYAVRAIRSVSIFAHVPIVFIPENAPGKAGAHMHQYLHTYPMMLTMRECGNKYGVPVGHDHKDKMTWGLQRHIGHHLLFYSQNMKTHCENNLSDVKAKLEKQLLAWEKIVEYDPTKPESRARYHWSGKRGAGNDDLACALMMNAYWPEFFYGGSHPSYTQFILRYVKNRRRN